MPRERRLTVCLAFALAFPVDAALPVSADAQVKEIVMMEAFNRALGVECSHCHVQDRWLDDSKPAFATSRNMYRMVREVNDRLLLDVGTVTC